jgi:hypothetical protein
MKKAFPIIVSIIAVILIVVVIVQTTRYRRETARLIVSQQAEEAVRTQFGEALQSIAEIQDSLTAMVPQEASLLRMQQGAEMSNRTTQTQKERMLSTIADLKTSIRNTRDRIQKLETDLKGSQGEVAGLKRIVANLRNSIVEKEAMIARLTGKVDSLQVAVTGLKADVRRGEETIAGQTQVIEQKRQEIGTVYYVVGTKKDLKAKGIIVDKGGVLGIGKSEILTGAMQQGDFTAIDTDSRTEILIQGKKPQVLSAQTKSSYELRIGATESALRILDPGEFRRVKYVVIMVE